VLGGMVSSLLHVLIVTPVIFTWLREREIRRGYIWSEGIACGRFRVVLLLLWVKGYSELTGVNRHLQIVTSRPDKGLAWSWTHEGGPAEPV